MHENLREGDIVRYVAALDEGRGIHGHYPAMVTRIFGRDAGLVNLTVFGMHGGVVDRDSISYDEASGSSTWHYR